MRPRQVGSNKATVELTLYEVGCLLDGLAYQLGFTEDRPTRDWLREEFREDSERLYRELVDLTAAMDARSRRRG